MLDIVEKIDDNENFEKNECYIDFLTLIIFNFFNFPNNNLLKTISNAEKFLVLLFKDFNEINLKYDIKTKNIKDDSLKIFKDIFVNNNEEHCFLLINQKILDLNDYIQLSDILDIKNINLPYQLEVKLIERKENPMTDMSFMFYEVLSLNSESNFTGFNTINITNISYMFYNCYSLKNLPDISNFNTKNITQMNYTFYKCSSLITLPDISKWNVENVRETDYMFFGCKSLTYLPDISDWNISKFESMNYMFKNCVFLTKLFDTKKWEKKNRNRIRQTGILDGCTSLKPVDDSKDNLYKDIIDFSRNYLKRSKCKLSILIFLLAVYPILTLLFIGYGMFKSISAFYNASDFKEFDLCLNNPNEYWNIINYIDILNETMYQMKENLLFSLDKLKEAVDYDKEFFRKYKQKIIKLSMKPLIVKFLNNSKECRKTLYSINSSYIFEENFIQNDTLNISLSYEELAEYSSSKKIFICLSIICIVSILIIAIRFIISFLAIKFIYKYHITLNVFRLIFLIFSFILFISSYINAVTINGIKSKILKILDKIKNDFETEITQTILNKQSNFEEYEKINYYFIAISIIFLFSYCANEKRKAENREIIENESIKLLPNN